MTLNDVGLFYGRNPDGSPDRGALLFEGGQFENAHLTGGASANRFYVNWSHTATVEGLGGNDSFFLNAFTGTGTFQGGEGDDSFVLLATSTASLDGAGVNTLVDGGPGRDTIAATGDVNFVAGDHQLERFLPRTRTTPRTSVINTFDSIESVTLTGGAHANLLDAGQFSGTCTLIGDAGVDNLIASKGGGKLYGYTMVELNAALTAGDHGYTRDNYFLSDGTADAATDTIYATARPGNIVSFRYYQSPTHSGVTYALQDTPDGAGQLVSHAGAPSLHVALGFGRLSVLEGSSAADKLTGNKLPNILSGLGGNDLLVSIGVDVLLGGAGHDSFQGFTPYRFQDLGYTLPNITGIAAIPPVAVNATVISALAHGSATHTSAVAPEPAALPFAIAAPRAEFTWLDPIASIIAAA
jgi:hypothetical protein